MHQEGDNTQTISARKYEDLLGNLAVLVWGKILKRFLLVNSVYTDTCAWAI
jgi:hypothetical protein